MCILFILRRKSSSWPVLIATNRDEFYNREFEDPGFHWKAQPSIFAGKDNKAGGSWLGLNANGLCVAILNRKSDINNKFLKSRGSLVINALKNKTAISAKKNFLKLFEEKYNFFNLFIADNKNAYWIRYDKFKLDTFTVPFGHSIIDNLDINDNQSQRQELNRKDFISARLPEPDKNFFNSWQKLLTSKKQTLDEKDTSIYVNNVNNNYGTVCSSIIGLPHEKSHRNKFWLYRNAKKSQSSFKKLRMFENKK